jgi:hypothetical protein
MPKSPEGFEALREDEAPRVAVVARRGDFFATAFFALRRRIAFDFPFVAARLTVGRFPARALRRDAFFAGFFLAIGGTPLPARR